LQQQDFTSYLDKYLTYSLNELEVIKQGARESTQDIHDASFATLAEKKVLCVRPTANFNGFFASRDPQTCQSPAQEKFRDLVLPFDPVPISQDSCAVSYRHGGDSIWCCLEGRPDLAISVNRGALVALEAAGRLGRSLWIDCVCIPVSGQTLGMAFGYMGCLYSAVCVYSQVNWIEDVDNYLSRGWVMQEFLLANQILSPKVEADLVETIGTLQGAQVRILDVLRSVVDVDATGLPKLSASLDKVTEDLSRLLETRGVKILQYLTNDVHDFWFLQVRALNQLLKRQLQGPTQGTSSAEAAARHEGGKLCACLPRCFLLSRDVLTSVLKLQSPTPAILGRLENAYFTADLTVETDRLVAIFGVYNFLSKSEISGPVFSGVWPSLRGTRVRARNVASGFAGSSLKLKAFPVESLRVAPVIFEEVKDSPEALDKIRLNVFAVDAAGNVVGLWTFSQLTSTDPAHVFKNASVYASEIDSLFGLKTEGAIGTLFARLAESGKTLVSGRQEMPEASRYRYLTHFGEVDITLT